jgi:hypothetical protein
VACSGLSIDLGVALYGAAPLLNLYQRSCFKSFAFPCTDFFFRSYFVHLLDKYDATFVSLQALNSYHETV